MKLTEGVQKHLYLSFEDAALLAAGAQEKEVSEAAYLRLLIRQKPSDYPQLRQLLKDLNNEVNRIGVNINQIVYSHNAGIYDDSDRDLLVALLKKVQQSLVRVEDKIGDQ